MHHIQSAAIPPKVVTAVSGVSTPSSIGQVVRDTPHLEAAIESNAAAIVAENQEAITTWAEGAKFIVTWKNLRGQPRQCGRVSGGLSPEGVVRLLALLTRNGINLVNVEKVEG